MAINIAQKIGGPPYVLNSGSAQANGLVFWAPMGAAGAVQDPIQNLTVSQAVAGGTAVPYITPNGLGLDCNAVNRGFRVAAPSSLTTQLPVSVMCVFYQVATPGASGGKYFGVTFSNTDTTPFNNYAINCSSSVFRGEYNNAGANLALAGAAQAANGALHVGILSVSATAQALYLDAVSVASSATAVGAPTVGTPQLGIGVGTSDLDATRVSGAIILDCRIYNRALTLQDAIDFSANWTDLYGQVVTRWGKKAAAGGTFKPFWAVGASQLISGGMAS